MTDTNIRYCEYCGQPFHACMISRHTASCIDNPRVRELTYAALNDNGRIRSIRQYEQCCECICPNHQTLRARFGTWKDVAAVFGLTYGYAAPDYAAIAEKRAVSTQRRVDVIARRQRMGELIVAVGQDATEYAQERTAAEQNYDYGLQVCRVRELPSGGVAYLLR